MISPPIFPRTFGTTVARGARRALLAVLCAVGAIVASGAAAQGVDAIAVKLADQALPPGATTLPAALHQAVQAALGVPFAAVGRTRDGAFRIALPAALPIGDVRRALNRIRLETGVLYAAVAPGAPVPDTGGPPTDRLIVKFKVAAGADVAAASGTPPDAARVARLTALAGVPVAWLRNAHNGSNVLQMLRRLPIGDVEAIAARIAAQTDVDYAQPDYIRTTQATPSDPCYASASVAACSNGYQWDLFDPVGGINMPAAWDITTGAAGIRVAVIDTGALFDHPDLAGRFVGGYDMIADCAVANDGQPGPCTWSNQTPDLASRDANAADPGDWVTAVENAGLAVPPYDWFQNCGARNSSWHGTHVAGTIGAVPNNGIGIAGINWISQIVPVRVLGKCGGYDSDIADAMVWAAGGSVAGAPANPNPARVLNLSLGGGGSCDAQSQSAINTALGLGAVVVVAAGNNNDDAANHSPASCSGVITVAATTRAGRRARYSNYGALVEIAAPGGNADGVDPDVLSTINDSPQGPNPVGYIYARYAGTSMATPHVSGVASLMLAVNPALTPAQVAAKIQSSARAFPTPGPACNPVPQASACNCTTALCGAGILDAAMAVAAASPQGTTLASSANPAPFGTAITFTATVNGDAPTGSVGFADGGTALAGCAGVPLAGAGNIRTAACTTSALGVGSHAMTASYAGDANNPPAGAMLTQVVTQPPSATAVTSSANPSIAGLSVTFTAAVAGAVPTGTVKFDDGGTAIAGCGAVALAGSGNVRTAACATAALATGSHAINATYGGDAGNAASTGTLTQVVSPPLPGTATVVVNPYGPVSVQGAALVGNTISNFTSNVVIQLGSVSGVQGAVGEIDFQGLNLGPGAVLTIRSGAPGQFVFLVNTNANGSAIAGTLQAQGGNGAAPPALYVKNPNGLNVVSGGSILAPAGLGIATLGASWTTGNPIVNAGTLDGGTILELLGSRINGGGAFKGNSVTLRTFGNANNPVNGAFFLSNGLQLFPSTGNAVALTLNAYGSVPQFINVMVNGDASLWMPSAWPAGSTVPPNNAVLAPGATRPAGVPDPAYGGGSIILQATGAATLVNGGTNDFAFPGGIAIKAGGVLNLNAVLVNQGWTTSGKSFQGIFFESPTIVSPAGNIPLYSNNLNWMNFSTFPQANVRAFVLARNPDGSASFQTADTTAPHLNTYSLEVNTAASGGCWTCVVNTNPVNMYGP